MISGTITNAFSFCLKKSFNSIMRVLDEADFGDDKIHFQVSNTSTQRSTRRKYSLHHRLLMPSRNSSKAGKEREQYTTCAMRTLHFMSADADLSVKYYAKAWLAVAAVVSVLAIKLCLKISPFMNLSTE